MEVVCNAFWANGPWVAAGFGSVQVQSLHERVSMGSRAQPSRLASLVLQPATLHSCCAQPGMAQQLPG